MTKSFAQLRGELTYELLEQIQGGTHNSFATIVEAVFGKEKADELRKVGIEEGKWIKMDGVIYNGS